jgi:hypothetical protein
MKQALKDQPVVTLQAPSGVQEVQGDWLYDEFVGGGYISYLGMEPGNPPSVQVAGAPRDAAASEAVEAVPMQPTGPNATILQPMPTTPPGQSVPRVPPSGKPAASTPTQQPTQEPFQRLAPGLR